MKKTKKSNILKFPESMSETDREIEAILFASSVPLSVIDIENKIKERNQARDSKNYELADKIRNELLEKGVQIEDKDGKTSWKFK